MLSVPQKQKAFESAVEIVKLCASAGAIAEKLTAATMLRETYNELISLTAHVHGEDSPAPKKGRGNPPK